MIRYAVVLLCAGCFAESVTVADAEGSSSSDGGPITTPLPMPWGDDESTGASSPGGTFGVTGGGSTGGVATGATTGPGSTGTSEESGGSSDGSSTGAPPETAYGPCYDGDGAPLCEGSCILNADTGASACAPDCLDACPESGACLDELADQVVGPVCVLPCDDATDCQSGLCEHATSLTVGGEPLLACMWGAR